MKRWQNDGRKMRKRLSWMRRIYQKKRAVRRRTAMMMTLVMMMAGMMLGMMPVMSSLADVVLRENLYDQLLPSATGSDAEQEAQHSDDGNRNNNGDSSRNSRRNRNGDGSRNSRGNSNRDSKRNLKDDIATEANAKKHVNEKIETAETTKITKMTKITETTETAETMETAETIEMMTATPADALEDIFMSMPEMDSEAFTDWFFAHTDRQELWDWVFAMLEGEAVYGYSDFMNWYAEHEARVMEAWTAFSGVTVYRSAVGDLWEDWNGTFTRQGDGSKEVPYQIGSLSELMGLSEAVAAGEDFEGQYFELTQDIDLDFAINSGNWNPIGWYQNRSEFAGETAHPFRGHLDGRDHTISGLRIVNPSWNMKNIGLFGVIDGGSVRNLTLEAEEVSGVDQVGLLAGRLTKNTIIYNVTVSGYAHSQGNAGGIAGEILGDTDGVTIENCSSYGIVLNSSGEDSYVGGIAGSVTRAYLVDNEVLTQDGDADRIQGKGYVGGIAGCLDHAAIYNSYVDGTIGGNGSKAVGGIAGEYRDGVIVLARMAGDIARTNQGTAKREGIFVGTRKAGTKFTYGTDKNDNLSYLYTVEDNRGKAVFGSAIDGDNSYTKSAHIGYWTDNEKKYVTVAGKTEHPCGDRYFYEELEDGVRYIVTQKLSRELHADEYADGLTFHVDHFAPGYMGEPVRGYLVYVPVIHAVNDNGTLDKDVAALTALPLTNNSYYRTIDKDHAAAVMPGATVTVLTAPKNTGDNRYQMVVDRMQAGGVKAPTYTDEQGNKISMNYVTGGSYTFVMPECDTQLQVSYEKVTTRLSVAPEETSIHVIQTRSGDRKHPQIVTEVKNDQGILIARYINEAPDTSVQVQPVTIHVEHNGAGATVDRTVKWSVDDKNLIINQSEQGYTYTDARILPNLDSDFIQKIISQEVKAQAENQYREKINNTIYTRDAVVTATTNPDTSVDHRPVYANTRVHVTFQILDQTTVRVEGLVLNQNKLILTVTRRLTGYRYEPTETITCSSPVVLTATLYPEQPFYKLVNWADRESGKIIHLKPSGSFTQDCTVSANFDSEGKENPAWIQNIINADNEKRSADPAAKLEGSGSHTEVITAVSEDQTHGHVTASCQVTVRFVTIDETTLNRYSGSGGGSSGGGGGSSGGGSGNSRGVTALGASGTAADLPSYVVSGKWIQNDAGKWLFTDGIRTYAGEWAAVHNPYANPSIGQSVFDWFLFDADGFMVTGWYTDTDGSRYYLHSDSDGTLGRMYTGWNWIDGRRYYFNEVSDGTRGALKCNFTAPDGTQTNQDGIWIVDGAIQIQLNKDSFKTFS